MASHPIPDASEVPVTVTAGSCPTPDPLAPIYRRLEYLERELPDIKKRLAALIEHREKKLKDKFRIHDRAVMLRNELEDWCNRARAIKVGVDLEAESAKLEEELRTIVKSLAELVDAALGL